MATDLFVLVAEFHILIDKQFQAVNRSFTRSFTRDEAVVYLQRSQRIFTLLARVNTRSVEKLTDFAEFNRRFYEGFIRSIEVLHKSEFSTEEKNYRFSVVTLGNFEYRPRPSRWLHFPGVLRPSISARNAGTPHAECGDV